GSIVITFRPAVEFEEDLGSTPPVTAQDTDQDTAHDVVTSELARMLPYCVSPISRKELMAQLGLNHVENFRLVYLHPALEAGLIERTLPDKPQSKHQQYRLTEKGQRWLRKRNSEA
ncbi:MAG TPA: transcriptional regulator, partial [Armatimonadota bacterium]